MQESATQQTGDAAECEESDGLGVEGAGFLPEAQQQLKRFVGQKPDHWRTPYGRNLLGRA